MSENTGNRPMAAAVSMLAAMMILGLIDNFVSVISETVGLWQFHAMRSIFMVPLLLGLVLLGAGRLKPKRWKPVFARAAVLAVSMLLYFGSLGLMPIAQALAGLFTSPIFILIINVLVMGLKIGPWRILAVFIGFFGIILVLQPTGDNFGPLMVMPVMSGFFYAISAIATRSWCAGESALSLLAANMMTLGGIGVVVAIGIELFAGGGGDGFLSRGWTWDIGQVLPWVIVQAAGSLIGVFLIIRAYQMDEPSNVSVFEYSIMMFGPAFAWILYGQTLGIWQGIGIAMIAGAGILIAFRSQ